jgi:hypothetical protein
VCACVCVCVRERERERERVIYIYIYNVIFIFTVTVSMRIRLHREVTGRSRYCRRCMILMMGALDRTLLSFAVARDETEASAGVVSRARGVFSRGTAYR